MNRFGLNWGAHLIAWLLSASLVLTPYAFAQESGTAGVSSEPVQTQEFLLAQDDTSAPTPEPSAESEPASEIAPEESAAEAQPAEVSPETGLEAGTETPPASADQALQQDSTPSLVSPEQVGESPQEALPPEASGEGEAKKPSMMSKVPWWVWALSAAAVIVLAGALSGGGGGGGGGGNDKKDDSDGGTVGYNW